MNVEEIILQKNKEIKDDYKSSVSVSKLCSEYLRKPFDDIKVAAMCYLKGLKDPTYKYANMKLEEILQQWKDKADTSKHYGSLLDDYAGLYLTESLDKLNDWKQEHNFETDERLKSTCLGMTQFYDYITANTNYKFVTREIPLYNMTPNGNKINGRLDCLLKDDTTDSYIIIDWKTTEDITTSSKYDKLLGPCSLLDDCDMNIYTLQLQFYKKALVETYQLATADKISVYVCNLLKESQDGIYYKLYKQNFEFDIEFLNSCIDYQKSN